MSINIDKNLCIGCGACAAMCPDAFVMNNDGKAEVAKDEVSECAKNAAASCPTQAIAVK
ncbi:MAG: ferredoxin [Patescibacteria group bacterium]|nr:ferredoxin [Patescibacteria group bacterium]MDD4611156.1 ferredoxin [Patescibacteria group bacterium]